MVSAGCLLTRRIIILPCSLMHCSHILSSFLWSDGMTNLQLPRPNLLSSFITATGTVAGGLCLGPSLAFALLMQLRAWIINS